MIPYKTGYRAVLTFLCVGLETFFSASLLLGQSSRFEIIEGAFSWDQAKLDAETRGGHLATITSQSEYDQVRAVVPASRIALWIGGFQPLGSPEPAGGWSWVTGEEWTFSVWGIEEPNNAGGAEQALMIRPNRNYDWNDETGADGRHPYLLELPDLTPRQAKATLQVINGFIVGATIIDPGNGYTVAPLVLILANLGSGATATATIETGKVRGIKILSAGSGYSAAELPEIVIASPPFEPRVEIRVSRVLVTQHVVLGRKYVLEESDDLVVWAAVGETFLAISEQYSTEVMVQRGATYFRLREVP